MSSPDPLNDDTMTSIAPPSSRRVTRSQRSNRFVSLASSPRKQTFELEVGDNVSPQRLLVTVETEDGNPVTTTRRRLFPSSSPFQNPRPRAGMTTTTTTTVPLRQSIEDEQGDLTLDSMATPRRRGRPRKTNGTPMPSAAKKRKAGTPIKQRTPRRQSTINELDPLSDPVIKPTPTPKKRGRPRKASTVEPSSELGIESASKTVSGRRGRRRRQALIPEELEELAEEAAVLPEAVPSEDDIDLIAAPPETFTDEPQPQAASNIETAQVPADPASDFDLWMNEASPERTPQAPAQPAALDQVDSRRSPSVDYESIASDNDFGGAPSPSPPAGSISHSSPEVMETRHPQALDNGDTIAQGEDFSMIFMESIQSFQDFKSSVPGPRQPLPLPDSDIGEEASLIINKTLESLRQSVRQEEEAEDEEMVQEIQEELELEQQNKTIEEPVEDLIELEAEAEEAHTTQGLPAESLQEDRNMGPEPVRTSPSVVRDQQDELASDETTPVFSPAVVSSPNRLLSPRWAMRGLRRPNISPMRQRLLKSQVRQLDDVQAVSEKEDTAPEASPSPQVSRITQSHEDDYEDSFSEIPQNVLEAATPRRPALAVPVPELISEELALEEEDGIDQIEFIDEPEEEEAELIDSTPLARGSTPVEDLVMAEEPDVLKSSDDLLDPQEPEEQHSKFLDTSYSSHQQLPPASNASSAAQTDRLPTPDDTPPNLQVEDSEDLDKPTEQTMRSSPLVPQLQLESQPLSSSVASDPLSEQHSAERPTISIEITPVNQLSSPANEPQSIAAESPMERAVRPALSAIVRAGRALQTITSDPPSPEPQEHQLGSPFRSSVSKDSWSGSRESATGRRSAIISPSRRSIGHQRQSASIDDPFISTSRNTGQSSFMQALGWSMSRQQSPEKSRVQPSGSASSSMRATPPDEELSWVANEGPISPRLRGDNSLEEAAGLPSRAADQPIKPPQIEIEEETPENLPQTEELSQRDDETDIWEVEAERSLLEPAPEQPSPAVFGASHRRGTIPSPWTRQNTGARDQATKQPAGVSEEKTAEVSAHAADQVDQEADETEEYSLLTQRRAAAEVVNEPASSAKGGRVDLSSFFSSPAAIPGILVNKLFPSRTSNTGALESMQTGSAPAPAIATTSMFPQVASNPFRQQSESPTDPVSPSKSSAPPSAPPSARKRSSSAPVAQEANPRSAPRRDLSSPFRSSRVAAPRRASADLESGSPATPEKIEMPIVAQKQNFTPRPRQTSQSFYQPPSSAPTPPRMQLSHADIQRWQQETSNASESSPDLGRSLLRPLPPRNASPTKSSLRSPLKPHTPGRVVEFTSSVLSPMEQARARQERRLSNASSSALAAITQNRPSSGAEPVIVIEDKENHDSDVSMSDVSPLPKQHHTTSTDNDNSAPAAAAGESSSSTSFSKKLSQTVWTREHWLFLDRILERRLVGDFEVDFPRRADRYLGKKVKSQGEAMVLERWHLDCVDAFRAVVGGWDEGDLAKRLFSLILAEERRKEMRGHTTQPSRVMFH